jgi:hypothetical protein
MKTYAPLACLVLAACGGGARPPVAATNTSSAPVVAAANTAAAAAPTRPPEPPSGGDPLGMDGALGALPEVVFTPPAELRRNHVGDLKEALALATRESEADLAAAKVTKRLGKPTWVENGTKRVWVVGDARQCQRLVLRGDGAIDLDGAERSEWRMLSTFARQNTCSGEVEKERGE